MIRGEVSSVAQQGKILFSRQFWKVWVIFWMSDWGHPSHDHWQILCMGSPSASTNLNIDLLLKDKEIRKTLSIRRLLSRVWCHCSSYEVIIYILTHTFLDFNGEKSMFSGLQTLTIYLVKQSWSICYKWNIIWKEGSSTKLTLQCQASNA